MPLHDPTQPAAPGLVPSIGETIADEGPSKAKQFFTDPKNLATMLVLASAIAQPKTGGRSNLAHTLRAGTGALAFRGGLNQQITEQEQTATETASVVSDRAAQQRLSGERTGVMASQVAATRRGQDVDVSEGALDRASEEKIAEERVAALSSQEVLENELIKIGVQGYHKAYSEYLLGGAVGSPPDPRAMIPLPEGMTIGPLDSEADVIVPGADGATPVPGPSPGPAPEATEQAVPFAPVLISGVPVTGQLSRGLRKNLPAENVRRTQLRVARQRYPEVYANASDDEIFDRIASVQADIKARLDAGMSQEVAQELKKDKFMLETMTREQRAEVLRISRGKVKLPGTTNF